MGVWAWWQFWRRPALNESRMERLARTWNTHAAVEDPPGRDPDGPVEVLHPASPAARVSVGGDPAVHGFAQARAGEHAALYEPTDVCPWCAQGHRFEDVKVEVATVEEPVLPAYNGGTYHEGCYELLHTMRVL